MTQSEAAGTPTRGATRVRRHDAGTDEAGTDEAGTDKAGTDKAGASDATGPPDAEPDTGAVAVAARHAGLPWSLGVATTYLALAVGIFHAAWGDLGESTYGGNDAMLFTWYLGWTPHALAHGLDPFVTHHLNAPAGANVLWSTPVPLLGLLAAPVTRLAGPVASLTVLLTLAPAVSGLALFRVLCRWVRPAPAALAGLLYGFGPYMVGASYGHLHLTFALFPPILLLLGDDLLVRRRGPRRTGILLGLAIVAQALIGEELLATSVLLGGIGLVVLALRNAGLVRSRLRPVLTCLGTAAGIAAVGLAWPLAVQFRGPQRISGSIQPHGIAVTDLLTFVTPTPMQRLAPDAALRHSLGFTGNAVEVSGYLGLPLIVLVVVAAIGARRHPLVRLFGPLGLVAAVFSLGGRLHVDGRATGIPLPWLPVQHLPVLSNALPSRLALYVMMCAAIVAAVGFDRLLPRPAAGTASPRETVLRGTALRWTVAVVLTLAVLAPLVPASMLVTPARTPAFFTGRDAALIPVGATALVVPFPYPQRAEAMLWQSTGRFRFVMPGCYCTVPGPDGRASFHGPPDALTSALIDVDNGATTAAAVAGSPPVRAAYDRLAPDAVVLGPAWHTRELCALLGALAGAAPRRVGGVDLWLRPRPATGRDALIPRGSAGRAIAVHQSRALADTPIPPGSPGSAIPAQQSRALADTLIPPGSRWGAARREGVRAGGPGSGPAGRSPSGRAASARSREGHAGCAPSGSKRSSS